MYRDILLPVDLDETADAEAGLKVALEFARRFGARLHAVAVVPGFPMAAVESFFPEGYERRAIERATAHLDAFLKNHVPADVTVSRTVAHGRVHTEILRVASEIPADLIVLPAGRRTAEGGHRLEPTGECVAREADASVLVVRGD